MKPITFRGYRLLRAPEDMPRRIYLDGYDVSGNCTRAVVPFQAGVEGPGKVHLLKRDGNGYLCVDPATHRAAVETRRGMVRWEPMDTGGGVLTVAERLELAALRAKCV
jgi:hypothetical protein